MQSILPLTKCPDAQRMVEYLQGSEERARGLLSRTLHDDLGGLLVSVVMDVGFAEQHSSLDDGLRTRLARVRHTLAEAIDLKRKIIESLSPSMLENFGLFEALKWEVKQRCNAMHVPYTEIYPEIEPRFTKEASIALFRMAQESMNIALHQPSVTAAHMVVSIDADSLRIAISHEARPVPKLPQDDALALCSIAHRAYAFGGQLTLTTIEGGGAVYSARLPLARITTPPVPATEK
jgi:signal transduction histidine kinase